MRHTAHKALGAACAATLSATGLFITTPVAAHADTCVQFAFNGPYKFRTNYDSGVFADHETYLTGKSDGASDTAHPFDKAWLGEMTGNLKANIDGRNIHMTLDTGQIYLGNQEHYEFTGALNDEGQVRGGTGENTTSGQGFTWSSDTKLDCVESKPGLTLPKGPIGEEPVVVGTAVKADTPPDVVVDTSKPASVKVTVTDKSGVATTCTYTATPRQPTLLPPTVHNFDLAADGTYSWEYPAVRTFTTWDVVVDCGGKRKTTPQEVQY